MPIFRQHLSQRTNIQHHYSVFARTTVDVDMHNWFTGHSTSRTRTFRCNQLHGISILNQCLVAVCQRDRGGIWWKFKHRGSPLFHPSRRITYSSCLEYLFSGFQRRVRSTSCARPRVCNAHGSRFWATRRNVDGSSWAWCPYTSTTLSSSNSNTTTSRFRQKRSSQFQSR